MLLPPQQGGVGEVCSKHLLSARHIGRTRIDRICLEQQGREMMNLLLPEVPCSPGERFPRKSNLFVWLPWKRREPGEVGRGSLALGCLTIIKVSSTQRCQVGLVLFMTVRVGKELVVGDQCSATLTGRRECPEERHHQHS